MNTAQQMSMPAINKSNFHVRGLKINNEKKTIEEPVMPNDCDHDKIDQKVFNGTDYGNSKGNQGTDYNN